MPQLRLIGRLDHSVGWADGRLVNGELCEPGGSLPATLLGAVADVGTAAGGRCRLLRDPLGLNKLFWSTEGETLLIAGRPRRLVEVGCDFESIYAIPPGAVLDLDPAGRAVEVASLVMSGASSCDEPPEAASVPALAARMRARLDQFFAALAQAHPNATLFVCLSGGLDSAGIAVLAREHFPNVAAVSFDLRRATGQPSEDRRSARRLAEDLGLPLLCVSPTQDEVLALLDIVLVEGIDWRDFNVHCGLVNACLARGIAASQPGAVVLTGEFPNEFLVDYQPEVYRGQVYYRLPRISRQAQRAALVRGLETSNREVGPFEAWGLQVVQPYAAVADLFLGLPSAFLDVPDRKERLYQLLFGRAIPAYVYARPKTRAQVGDPSAAPGVLPLCANRGLDEPYLRHRFAELHGVPDPASLDHFIRAGRYRTAIPQLEGVLA